MILNSTKWTCKRTLCLGLLANQPTLYEVVGSLLERRLSTRVLMRGMNVVCVV